ncbi:MAG: vWA domain-containing protein, partial [Gammaproteobacteria bacterium]
MRNLLTIALLALVAGCAGYEQSDTSSRSTMSPMAQGELEIEIQSPSEDFFSIDGVTTIEVEGVASSIGGVRYLDMMLVMDTSLSLVKTDPNDYRSVGAIGLVKNLSPKSDAKIGVVSFNSVTELTQPMTSDRGKVVKALRELDRTGKTDLAAGIRTALSELDKNGRPGSSRVIMLFTDGKSNRKKALAATQEAQLQGVTIQTLLLGS